MVARKSSRINSSPPLSTVRCSNRLRASHSWRRWLSNAQSDQLEECFRSDEYPDCQTKICIAKRLGVDVEKVNNWFSNKRAKSSRSNSDTSISKPSPKKSPKKSRSPRKSARKTRCDKWPLPLDGPYFVASPDHQDGQTQQGKASFDDKFMKKIASIKTWKNLVNVCQQILEGSLMSGGTRVFQDHFTIDMLMLVEWGWTFYMGYASAIFCFLSTVALCLANKYCRCCDESYSDV